MLVGHPVGASGFAAIAALLAEDYTVVTYDPRGFARSTIDDPDQDAAPDLLADDVRSVLAAAAASLGRGCRPSPGSTCHGLLPIALDQPDIAALQAAPARVAVGRGTTSEGQSPWRSAVALAERLGAPLVDFPGGHVGFASDAEDFAAVLRRTLA
jgi:pimeloyl-ACP methyl ester carboxylesterase